MLLLALGFLSFMQTPWASGVYASLPGFDYIQFPWRLLSMITPLGILLVGWLVVGLSRVDPRSSRALTWLCLAGSIVLAPALGRDARAFIPTTQLESPLEASPDFVMLSGGEYLPVLALSDLRTVPHRLAYLHWLQEGFVRANRGCEVAPEAAGGAEQLSRRFAVRCRAGAEVVLPLMSSGLERAWLATHGGWVALQVRRTPADPRMHVVVPAGDHRLHVELPSFPAMLGLRRPDPRASS